MTAKQLNDKYLTLCQYGEVVSLDDLKITGRELEDMYNRNHSDFKFMIELLCFPSWAHKGIYQKVFANLYNHIRIKKDISKYV